MINNNNSGYDKRSSLDGDSQQVQNHPPSSISFAMAPPPILRDDGEITVADSFSMPYSAPIAPPSTAMHPSSLQYSAHAGAPPPQASFASPPSVSMYSSTPPPPPAAFTASHMSAPPPSAHSYPPAPSAYSYPPPPPSSIPPIASNMGAVGVPAPQMEHRTSSETPLSDVPGSSMIQQPRQTEEEEEYQPQQGELIEQQQNQEQNALVPYQSQPVGNGFDHKTYPKEVLKMKVQRKRMTIAAGVTGGLVGLVALGPLGAVVGATGGAVATRAIGKRRERKKRDKIADRVIAEQDRNAPEVDVHKGTELL